MALFTRTTFKCRIFADVQLTREREIENLPSVNVSGSFYSILTLTLEFLTFYYYVS